MDTFAGILVGIIIFFVNFGLYKSVEELYVDLPKWLRLIMIILPPLGIVSIVLISMGTLCFVVYDTIKNL
jgi:nucleoside recognition membrane protein YjiH